jgi:hypothetical protein
LSSLVAAVEIPTAAVVVAADSAQMCLVQQVVVVLLLNLFCIYRKESLSR